MNVEERLAYERRVGMRQAAIAALAGILLLGGAAIQRTGPMTNIAEQTLGLLVESRRATRDTIGPVLQGLGYFALGATLYYLFGVTRARNEAVRPRFIGIIGVAGGVLGGIGTIALWIVYVAKAKHFATHGNQTWMEANQQLSSVTLVVPQFLNYLGVLLTAVAVVLASLNAMRVGLLTKAMGYFGIFAGALIILPLVPIPIVLAFWLFGLAALFVGRFPGGVPPAWRTGKAEAWPSNQEIREQRMRARGGGDRGSRSGGGFLGGRSKPAPPPPPPPEATVGARTRATTPKRKRKRRR
jgi:hypothetical protein